MTIDPTQMLIDGYSTDSPSVAPPIVPNFETKTRREAIENVNAIRDELQTKGKNPQEIFKNKKYQKARAELDAAVQAANIVSRTNATTSVVNDSNNQFKPPTPGSGRTWKSSDGKYEFETEGAFIDYEKILAEEKSEAAAEKALTAKLETQTLRAKTNAREFLLGTLRQYFASAEDAGFVTDLEKIIDDYIRQDYDAETISVLLPQTEPYKKRFSGNQPLIAAGMAPLSPAEYLKAESQYTEILKRYDLNDLARRDTFATLIGGQVSAVELTDRVVNVYDRIRNADPLLRAEIDRVEELSRGQLTDADFAKALLTGSEGSNELKRKISTAEISAEARTRGLDVSRAEQLQQLGVTRAQARTGFEQIRLTQPRLTQLSEIYTGETPEATGLQTELEAEQFQGLQSERRRRLAEQEQTAFMGQSGTQGIGLRRRSQRGLI
jgi:hypothetical protein